MKRILTAAVALTVLAGSVGIAQAQPPRYDNQDRRDNDRRDNDRRGPDRSWDDHRHHPDWRSGHRLDQRDWSRGRHIDYRTYKLRKPPRGYEWRQIDGDFVLAAVATGLIASIIAHR
jgi:Ni/Co efflux regulator RcnB